MSARPSHSITEDTVVEGCGPFQIGVKEGAGEAGPQGGFACAAAGKNADHPILIAIPKTGYLKGFTVEVIAYR